MRIERKPALVRRGVQQLMYVGDDDAVDKAVASGKLRLGPGPMTPTMSALFAGGIAALLLGKGAVRIAGGIATAVAALSITD